MAGVRPVSVPDGGVCGPAEDDRNIAACAILKQWVTQNPSFQYTISGQTQAHDLDAVGDR